MLSLTLLALAFAPVIALGLYIYGKDKYDPEPVKALVLAFLLGCLSIIPAILFSVFISKTFPESIDLFGMALHAFIAVAFAEEITKFAVVRIFIYDRDYFNEPFDGIIYCVMVGLGFALVENVFYILQDGTYSVAILRMFTAVPGHAVYGVAMGYFVGKAKFDEKATGGLMLSGILLATVMHGCYDFFIFQQNYPALAALTLVGLILSVRWSLQAIKKQQKESRDLKIMRDLAEQERKRAEEDSADV